jgi:hypothetical protein
MKTVALALALSLSVWSSAFAAERAKPPIIAENEPPNHMENHGVYARACETPDQLKASLKGAKFTALKATGAVMEVTKWLEPSV